VKKPVGVSKPVFLYMHLSFKEEIMVTQSTTENSINIKKPKISFEFFPPKTPEGRIKFDVERDLLKAVSPSYFSVTYGAGGTTRDNTLETVLATQKATGIATAPHLSCIGGERQDLIKLINTYKDNGVQRIVALRGDLPSGSGVFSGEFTYAKDLVKLIREVAGDYFSIEVGAYPEMHPQAQSYNQDFLHFKAKVDAGATSAITQYFYNASAYEHFMNLCNKHDIHIPIIPGIMPITNYSRLARFSQMCGAEIPRWLEKQLIAYGDDSQSIQQLGEEVVSRMVEELITLGAPGFHFYTLNKSAPSLAICKNTELI